jgi:hypothetical protein
MAKSCSNKVLVEMQMRSSTSPPLVFLPVMPMYLVPGLDDAGPSMPLRVLIVNEGLPQIVLILPAGLVSDQGKQYSSVRGGSLYFVL